VRCLAFFSKSIFSDVLTSKFSYFLFSNLARKRKLKLRLQIGGRLLVANHLVDQKQWAAIKSYSLHSSLTSVCAVLPIFDFAQACFEFSSSNFNLQGHILSIGGVAWWSNLVFEAKAHFWNDICWENNKVSYSWCFCKFGCNCHSCRRDSSLNCSLKCMW
jgi:hypothetical protein